MCEAVENYAKEYAKECSIRSSANIIKNTMESTNCTYRKHWIMLRYLEKTGIL